MTLVSEPTELDRAREAFRLELLDAGVLIATSSPGVYGRSAVFERILTGLDAVLLEMAEPLQATAVRFPPVYPRADFERTDYIASFPDLSGIVSSFEAGDRAVLVYTLHWKARFGPTLHVDIATHLHTRDGKLVMQRDYWDVSSTLIRGIPIIGAIYRRVAKALG